MSRVRGGSTVSTIVGAVCTAGGLTCRICDPPLSDLVSIEYATEARGGEANAIAVSANVVAPVGGAHLRPAVLNMVHTLGSGGERLSLAAPLESQMEPRAMTPPPASTITTAIANEQCSPATVGRGSM
eukprot:scaffold288540_cov43-Tisochrysis_lutea.AAC.1